MAPRGQERAELLDPGEAAPSSPRSSGSRALLRVVADDAEPTDGEPEQLRRAAAGSWRPVAAGCLACALLGSAGALASRGWARSSAKVASSMVIHKESSDATPSSMPSVAIVDAQWSPTRNLAMDEDEWQAVVDKLPKESKAEPAMEDGGVEPLTLADDAPSPASQPEARPDPANPAAPSEPEEDPLWLSEPSSGTPWDDPGMPIEGGEEWSPPDEELSPPDEEWLPLGGDSPQQDGSDTAPPGGDARQSDEPEPQQDEGEDDWRADDEEDGRKGTWRVSRWGREEPQGGGDEVWQLDDAGASAGEDEQGGDDWDDSDEYDGPDASAGEGERPEGGDEAHGGCSVAGEDCSQTQCCSQEGHQCYRKNEYWSSCSPACLENKGWSCEELGERASQDESMVEKEVSGGGPLGCSMAGEDCSQSQCCSQEGHQCYRKNEYWATCSPVCPQNKGWSCEELGERAPLESPGSCSAPGENCAATRCCSEPGMQCYAMDDFASWSSCAYACEPGVAWAENWTCAELGERAKEPLGCAWSGQACITSRTCCHSGQRCVKKNAIEAYCTHHEEAPDSWSGEVIGKARSEWRVPPATDEARGTSLFCFMAVLPDSYEEQLRDLAQSKVASIFACDSYTTFSTWKAEFVKEGTWNSVVNTDVFQSVWEMVKQDGQYRWNDWTVKVDADSVFFPDRLKVHLDGLRAPKDVPIYVKNTDIDFGFLGAIEVFSKEALDKLFWEGILTQCKQEVGVHSGEDGYIKGCMDMIGAGFMEDIDVLRTPASSSCDHPKRVCFHAFKDAGSWEQCYNVASQQR